MRKFQVLEDSGTIIKFEILKNLNTVFYGRNVTVFKSLFFLKCGFFFTPCAMITIDFFFGHIK